MPLKKKPDERFQFELPPMYEREEMLAFIAELETVKHEYAVARLIRILRALLKTQDKEKQLQRQARTTVQVVNGQRTPLQAQKDRERGLRQIAQHFYAMMSRAELERCCGIFSIAHDDFTTKEELINGLVEEYVTTVTHAEGALKSCQ